MNASTHLPPDDILSHAKKQAVLHALFRPESALVLSISILLTGLCLLNMFWVPAMWWMWLLFGVLGVAAIVIASVSDEKYVRQLALKLFYEHYDKTRLRLPELKQSVSQALDYHRLIFQEISERPHAPLASIALDMDQLVAGIYRVAYMLDAFVSDERIRRYLAQLIESQNGQNATTSSVEEYTRALMPMVYTENPFNPSNPANEKLEMVDNVCRAVATARGQLKDTLTNISAVHRKVSGTAITTTWQGDWSFVDVVHDTFTEYMHSLEDNAIALDNLYSSCTLAAMSVRK